MQLFTRTVTLNGAPADIGAYATDMRSYVSGVLGTEIGLWGVQFGAPAGTMVFSTRVDGLAGAAAMTATLMADEGYHAKIANGQQYVGGPAQDQILNPLHGEIGEGPPPVGAIATVTTAVASAGFDQAVGWGIELAQLAESVMGLPVIFGAGIAGTFGEFAWLSIAPDAAAADAANEAVLGSADYITKISGATDLFVPGGAQRAISTRVA